MANALGGVNSGGALAFVASTTYVTSATVASSVLDTGRAGSSWDALIWDETLPSSATDITFEVRASDTLFAKDADNATLAWIPVGGTAPIPWELPAGQYKQWRATLTTSDTCGDATSQRGPGLPLLAAQSPPRPLRPTPTGSTVSCASN